MKTSTYMFQLRYLSCLVCRKRLINFLVGWLKSCSHLTEEWCPDTCVSKRSWKRSSDHATNWHYNLKQNKNHLGAAAFVSLNPRMLKVDSSETFFHYVAKDLRVHFQMRDERRCQLNETCTYRKLHFGAQLSEHKRAQKGTTWTKGCDLLGASYRYHSGFR